MTERSFVSYVEEPVHDGVIASLNRIGDLFQVVVKLVDGRMLAIDFHATQSVRMHRPEGMFLYSLSEMSAHPPFRCFDFTNWDDDDDAFLEVVAEGFQSHYI